MRAVIVALVTGVDLAPIAVQAAPLAPGPSGQAIHVASQEWAPLLNGPTSQASVDTAPPTKLVAEGCAWGWHRNHWRGPWGHWHWGHCVPNWR
jgi:hypothetical protein